MPAKATPSAAESLQAKDWEAHWMWGSPGTAPETKSRGGLLLLVNFEGRADFLHAGKTTEVPVGRVALGIGIASMTARRASTNHQRFLCLRAKPAWLAKWSIPAPRAAFQLREINEQIGHAARDFIENPPAGPMRPAWREAKFVEILTHAMARPENDSFHEKLKGGIASRRVHQVKRLLAENLENPPTLAQLARSTGVSPFHLSRIFSGATGKTIPRHLRDIRLEKAAELLRSGRANVTEAATAVGYSSLSHFSTAFTEKYSVCPYGYLVSSFSAPSPHPAKKSAKKNHPARK
jgi:AraC-like DNA-binding protein